MIAGGVGIAGLVAVIGSAIGNFLSTYAKQITIMAAVWVAYKTFTIFLVYVVLPIVLYNILLDLVVDFISYALTFMDQQALLNDLTIQFTNMGGWLAQQIQLPQAFSIFMSFLAIKFITRFIPFLK